MLPVVRLRHSFAIFGRSVAGVRQERVSATYVDLRQVGAALLVVRGVLHSRRHSRAIILATLVGVAGLLHWLLEFVLSLVRHTHPPLFFVRPLPWQVRQPFTTARHRGDRPDRRPVPIHFGLIMILFLGLPIVQGDHAIRVVEGVPLVFYS